MKKLLLISIVLVVAGLGLILYSDPIVTIASGNGGHQLSAVTTLTNPNGNGGTSNSSGGPVFIGSGPGPNGTKGGIPGSFATEEYLTIAGIAFVGVGVFLTAVESIARTPSAGQPKTVT